MLVLTVLQGPDKGRRFELPDDEPQLIGRSSEALPLTDATISRRHAELTPDPDEKLWHIRDLGSANGTFVNGTVVREGERRLLRPGDQVRTGATLCVFGVDAEVVRTNKHADRVRAARRGEIDVAVESTVASNDDSLVMASPDPSHAAQFQLKVIYELVALIGSVTDRQELLEKVMDVTFDYFKADRGFILLQSDAEEEPEVAVVRHLHGPKREEGERSEKGDGRGGGGGREGGGGRGGRRIAYSRTIVRYVLRKEVGVLSSNAMNDERFAAGDSVQNYHIRSAMCVPIRYRDRLSGVIHLDSQVANFTYTEDQLTLLTAIGVQTGLALANLTNYQARLQSERMEVVGQTVASLSHSIKNILQGMRGGADVVELGLKKGNIKLVDNGWTIVSRNLDRIYDLTLNMLAFSKQRKPELELTNLEPLLEEVVELVQRQFDSKGVALILDMDEGCPPVPVDPRGLHQAVVNLLSNALDAVEPEAGLVTLRTRYDEAVGRARIDVIDNGPGLSVSVRRRMFEPFQSTKGYGGTGLGLVVTKKVADEHGGDVEVESEEGGGSTFTLVLPTHAEDVPQSADTHGG